MSDEKRNFFVSYNKADKQWAKWIAAVLESEGYSCYIQAWDFRPGENFVLEMHDALVQSDRFIAVLSADYLAAEYCQTEWAAAFTKDPNSKKRKLVPVRVSDVIPEGLLADVIYIDLFGVGEAEAEKLLINGVDLKGIPRNRPTFPGNAKAQFPGNAKKQVSGSLPFNNLPYIRNSYFTGRDNVLENIRAEFESARAISLTQAIAGLGGLGKTQTALEYAYRYASDYDWIWWVSAETEATVLESYKDFAVRMKLLDAKQQDSKLIIETVLTWMDTHRKWLFIYDNIEDVSGDTNWWPRENRGNVLITTRLKHLHIGKLIDISLFTEAEAAAFLGKRTGIANEQTEAIQLSRRLGHLPLALEQAAAYIKNIGCTYGEYLTLLEENGLEVLEETEGMLDYAQPVTATWEISINRIGNEAARQLLYLCAYLASENIEASLFSDNAELLPSPLREQMSKKLTGNKVWSELTRYSLLGNQGEKQGYSMHRLLQEVVRNQLRGESLWAQCCLEVFYKTYDFLYGDVEAQNRFLKYTPHVEVLLDAAASSLTGDEEQEAIALLYAKGGFGFLHLGTYRQALEWYDKALAIREKMLGKEHPSTAIIYNNIAFLYDSLGDYPKALEWYGKALAIKEKVLGMEQPSTATTYNNIALVYDSLGDYPKALEWYGKALAIKEKALGKEHPSTTTTYNNIAGVYKSQGDYSKALELYYKDLAVCEKVLGEEHPSTATAYNNIAGVYKSHGDYPKALEWYDKALAIREKVLGKEHPDTAITYNNIASVYDSQGDYPKALEWYGKALAICEKVLGQEHPNTQIVRANMQSLQE